MYKINAELEQAASNTNIGLNTKDETNSNRQEWPSKRNLYTICGILGEGATGNQVRVVLNSMLEIVLGSRRYSSLGNVQHFFGYEKSGY